MNPLACAVIERCTELRVSVATAESLTAGLCAATLAEVPGASAVLRGGLIVYATDLKRALAGVDGALLDAVGPVDEDVAIQLARGAAERCGSEIGIGLTGVAGPDAQDEHPVGEIYVAVAVGGRVSSRCIDAEVQSLRLKGALNDLDSAQQRLRLRELTVDCALFDTLKLIDQYYGSNTEHEQHG